MLKPLIALVAAAALAATAVSGCGFGDADPAAVAQAAEKTRAADSARVGWRVTTEGFGLPTGLTVTGDGTTSLDAVEMDLQLDLGPALALAGAPGGGKADVVLRGKDLYVKPRRVDGFALPGGAEWVALDLAQALAATGTDAAGLGEIVTLDPAAQIDVLRSAKGVEEVGEERVGGAATTHYRGEISLSDFADTLPAERRERAREAIEQFIAETGGDQAQPFEVWIDDRDRIRRMTQRTQVPGQDGVPSGEVGITMELSDFGATVDAKAPAARDTFDATKSLTDALAGGAK